MVASRKFHHSSLVSGGASSQASNEQARYLERIRSIPTLSEMEEQKLTRRWYGHGDRDAYDTLIASHLRLVPTIAKKFAGYGIDVNDLIGEGSIGLMQSAERFKPDKGFRFSTYARWWIKAAILNFILQTWSLIKVGKGAVQKRLFFNLRRAKRELTPDGARYLSETVAEQLAIKFGTSQAEVMAMDQRMSATEASLDLTVPGTEKLTFAEIIADGAPTPEDLAIASDELRWRTNMMKAAMQTLDRRERDIVQLRYLAESPTTLAKLALVYGLTAERIRQIEAKAILRLKGYIKPRLRQPALGAT